MKTTKISKERIQELIDKYSEDTFADLLDLAHYTIDNMDNIVNGLEELLILRKENKTLQQTTDMQHETTISDLKLIGKLQQENKYLIELCKGLFGILEGYLNEYGGWADDDIIGIEKCYKAIMQKHNINKTT